MSTRLHRTTKTEETEKIARRWERVAAIVITTTRRHKGVSQQELADKLGWTRNMLANLESGRRGVRFGDLILVAEALGIEPETLVKRIMQWESGGD